MSADFVRVATTQDKILLAVRDRLVDQLSELSRSNCELTLDPVPPDFAIARHNEYVTISIDNGAFDQGAHEGGGEYTTFENAGVVVTAFSRVKLDQPGRAEAFLTDKTLGILRLKHKILKALSGHDLRSGAVVDGTLKEKALLINLMAPLNSAFPQSGYSGDFGYLKMFFSTDFDWDLTS